MISLREYKYFDTDSTCTTYSGISIPEAVGLRPADCCLDMNMYTVCENVYTMKREFLERCVQMSKMCMLICTEILSGYYVIYNTRLRESSNFTADMVIYYLTTGGIIKGLYLDDIGRLCYKADMYTKDMTMKQSFFQNLLICRK